VERVPELYAGAGEVQKVHQDQADDGHGDQEKDVADRPGLAVCVGPEQTKPLAEVRVSVGGVRLPSQEGFKRKKHISLD